MCSEDCMLALCSIIFNTASVIITYSNISAPYIDLTNGFGNSGNFHIGNTAKVLVARTHNMHEIRIYLGIGTICVHMCVCVCV